MKWLIGIIICLIIILSGCPSAPQPSPPNLDDTEGFDEIWYEWLDTHLETCPNCDEINGKLWLAWEQERDLDKCY